MENYFTTPHSPLIKGTVCSLWQVRRQNNPAVHETIIPNGVVELIFSFENQKLYAQVNKQAIVVPKCFIQGYSTSPIHLNLSGQQTFFGVVLKPTAVKHICQFQLAEFNNCVVDLTVIDTTFYDLWHRLGEQTTFEARTTIFTAWLMERALQYTEREKAINIFLSSHTNLHLSVSEIARQFCYSSKQLSRKLNELTGLNTEQTLLYKKYLQALHLVQSSELSLTGIAFDCHFYDQSHFIKTFKSLSMLTPKEYRQRKSHVEGHLFENVY